MLILQLLSQLLVLVIFSQLRSQWHSGAGRPCCAAIAVAARRAFLAVMLPTVLVLPGRRWRRWRHDTCDPSQPAEVVCQDTRQHGSGAEASGRSTPSCRQAAECCMLKG